MNTVAGIVLMVLSACAMGYMAYFADKVYTAKDAPESASPTPAPAAA